MHNSCHSNCNLATERVTGSVDNSQSHGDEGEEMEDETVSQRREGSDKPTGVFLHGAMWKRAVKHSPRRGGHMMHATSCFTQRPDASIHHHDFTGQPKLLPL